MDPTGDWGLCSISRNTSFMMERFARREGKKALRGGESGSDEEKDLCEEQVAFICSRDCDMREGGHLFREGQRRFSKKKIKEKLRPDGRGEGLHL